MAIALPLNWIELAQDPDNVDSINQALALLNATLPNRYHYEQLDLQKLLRKMGLRETSDGYWVSGLRIFQRLVQPPPPPPLPTPPNIDIAAFFFLRLQAVNPGLSDAYCLTVGVTDTVVAASLYADIQGVCQYVAGQGGLARIEVINEFELPADLPGLSSTDIVSSAFTMAINAGVLSSPPRDIQPNANVWHYTTSMKSYLVNV